MNNARKSCKDPSVSTRIRFTNKAEMELVRSAAARRGLSFNRFVVACASGTAKRVMSAPVDDLLAEFISGERISLSA
jgi:uncharacterized protein (DUF1778 family)